MPFSDPISEVLVDNDLRARRASGPASGQSTVTSVRLSRVQMAVLAGVLEQRLEPHRLDPHRESSSETAGHLEPAPVLDGPSADGVALQDLADLARVLALALEGSTASHAAIALTPAAAHQVRVVVEGHYEEHHRMADGTQVALGRRLERLVRTLRAATSSPSE